MQVSEIFSKPLIFTDPLINPEERNLRPYCCENLKSRKFLIFSAILSREKEGLLLLDRARPSVFNSVLPNFDCSE